MWKLIKTFFIIAGIALFVLILLYPAFLAPKVDRFLTETIRRVLEDQLQREVSITRIHLSFPNPQLVISDIAIARKYTLSEGTLFKAKQVKARVLLKSLLSRYLVIDELLLEAPSVWIEVDEHGRSNLPVFEKEEKDALKEPSRFHPEALVERLSFPHIQILDAQIDLVHKQLPLTVSVQRLNTTFFLALEELYAQGHFTLEDGDVAYQDLGPIPAMMSGNIEFKENSLVLSTLRLGTGHSEIIVNGTMKNLLQPEVDLAVLATLVLDDVDRYANLDQHLTGRVGVTGTVTGPVAEMRASAHLICTEGTAGKLAFENAALDVRYQDNQVTLPRLEVDLWDGNIAGKAEIVLTDTPQYAANFVIKSLNLDHIKTFMEPPLPIAGVLNAETQVQGEGFGVDDLILQTSLALQDVSAYGIDVPHVNAQMTLQEQTLFLNSFSTQIFDGHLQGTARLVLAEELFPQFTTEAAWRDLSVQAMLRQLAPQDGAQGLDAEGKIGGQMTLTGDSFALHDLRGDVTLHGEGNLLVPLPGSESSPRALPFTLALESALSDQIVRVSTLNIDSLALHLFTSGTIDMRGPDVSVEYNVAAQDISTIMKQVLVFLPGIEADSPLHQFAGTITHIQGTLQGPLSQPTIRANAHLSDVDLVWLHADEIAADIGYQGTTLTLHRFRTHYQSAAIEAHGTIDLTNMSDPRFDLPVTIHAGELSEYLMLFKQDLPISGTLEQIEATLHGSLSQLTAAAQVSLVDARAWDQHVDRLFGDVKLVENRVVVSSLTITKNDGTVSLKGFYNADTSFRGEMTITDLNVRDIGAMQTMATQYEGQIDLSLQIAGTVANPQGSAHLSLNHLRYQGVPIHDITGEVSVAQQQMQGVLNAFQNMLSASFEVTLAQDFPYRAELVLEQAALDRLLAFVVDIEEISGRISGRMTSEGSLVDIGQLSGEITLSELFLDISGQTFKNVRPIDLVMTQQKLVVNAFELQGEQLGVFSHGVLDFQGAIDLEVDGQLDLRLIQPFLPKSLGITSLGGRVQLLCTVVGTLQDPVLEGIVELHHGRVRIAAYPDPVTKINGRVTLARGKITIPRLVGNVSQGSVVVRGELMYSDGTPDHFTVTMTGERLVLAEVVEALTLTISPSLTFSGDLQQQVLTGDLVIHEALYNKDLDAIVSNQERTIELITADPFASDQAASAKTQPMTLDLSLKTAEDIQVRNKQAVLDLRADLRIKGTPARPQVTGLVEVVKGDFFLFNTRYEVLNARFDFFDPRRINPELNIQLETLIREYTITVGLEGTLDRLDLSMSSNPILSENEILGLLLRGAGRSLQLVQGPILGWIEKTTKDLFSLDRVTLDTSPLISQGRGREISPTLTLIKRVFDKLLLTYITTVGGKERFQIFQGEYEVSEKVSAMVETDEKGDVDTAVIFKFKMK